MTFASAETMENCLWFRSQTNLYHAEFITNAWAGDLRKCSSSFAVKGEWDFTSKWQGEREADMSDNIQATCAWFASLVALF